MRHFPTKDQLIEATLIRSFERRTELARRLVVSREAKAIRAEVSLDEVYFLVRGLSQAAAASPVPAAILRGAIDVVLPGISGTEQD